MEGNRRGFRGRARGFPRGGNRGRAGFRGRGHNLGRGMHNSTTHTRRDFSSLTGPRLAEIDVGITEFIGKHAGFSAVMKHRFSDFHVNEIDSHGNIVKLTSLNIPNEEPEQIFSPQRHELIPEEIWLKLANMVKSKGSSTEEKNKLDDAADQNKSVNEDGDTNKNEAGRKDIRDKQKPLFVELDVTSSSKDDRRTIHKCVKEAFKDVNSNTVEKDGKKYVTFSLERDTRRNRGKWPQSRCGTYLSFVLHKKNMDTNETLNLISNKLRLKPGAITFAGTKDRRGVTSQLMCLRWGDPSRLFHLNKAHRDVFFGNYSFKEEPLRLGDLKGNQFRIALRNVNGSDEEINAGLESLKNNGFINYFGLQRFGTNAAVPTHSIGKALLQGDWKKAVDLILEPRDGPEHKAAALNEWKTTKNAAAALKKLGSRSNFLEGLLLEGLAKRGSNDLVNALSMLPRNTRSLYLHSYQSLIWNRAVSRRIQEYGLKPIVGDLILVKSDGDSKNRPEEIIAEDLSFLEADEDLIKEGAAKQEVKCITEEDLASVKIEDIVLPLPGYDIVLPNNSIGIFMADLLKEDGLSTETLRNSVKQYSVSGTYRHIVAKAETLTWKIIHYSDPQVDFIPSDLDEMNGKKIIHDETDGKYKAIVFSMCLEPSTYATMAIREITKEDTSSFTQASISVRGISSPSASLVQDITSTSYETVTAPKTEDVVLVDESAKSSPRSAESEGGIQIELPRTQAGELLDPLSKSPLPATEERKDIPDEKKDGLKRKAAVSSDEVTSGKRTKDM